jgi:type III secretory pathway component EscV
MKTEEPVKDSNGSTILVMALVVLILVLLIPFPKIVMAILIAANLILAALPKLESVFLGNAMRWKPIYHLSLAMALSVYYPYKNQVDGTYDEKGV